MAKMGKKRPEDTEEQAAAENMDKGTVVRISKDTRLRANGFHIAARPTKGSAVWERHGRKYPEAAALELCTQY